MEFNGAGFLELSEENIFKKVSEYDVFRYYIPDFIELNTLFSSPFRNDSRPSCSIQSWNNKLFFKDFGGTKESYTAVNFVKAKFNVSYYDALRIISNDFNLGFAQNVVTKSTMGYIGIPNPIKKEIPNKDTIIRIKRRKWNNGIDKKYWSMYGFNKAVLKHCNIVAISHLWINGKCFNIKPESPSYAYIIDKGVYKILSPYSEFKWVNNCKDHLQGYHQLPKTGELLIITKSLKDCGLLWKYGHIAVAPQSENSLIPMEMMDELKSRFNKIIVFFDNDDPGIEAAKDYEEIYNLESAIIPIGLPKDITDYYKEFGDDKTKQLIKELL
jgi:hypothetical protein